MNHDDGGDRESKEKHADRIRTRPISRLCEDGDRPKGDGRDDDEEHAFTISACSINSIIRWKSKPWLEDLHPSNGKAPTGL